MLVTNEALNRRTIESLIIVISEERKPFESISVQGIKTEEAVTDVTSIYECSQCQQLDKRFRSLFGTLSQLERLLWL